jgi:hypothetical protein
MIENHEQLKVTQEQIQRLEYVLEQLRQESSKVEFTAQAPTVVEHIRCMRAEIDEYLGIIEVESGDEGWASDASFISCDTQS